MRRKRPRSRPGRLPRHRAAASSREMTRCGTGPAVRASGPSGSSPARCRFPGLRSPMRRAARPRCRCRSLGVRGESTEGRVASAAGPDARRRPAGDVDVHRRGPPTTQMAPRRRNPEGAWVLRAIAALLLLDDPHRDRLRRRALRSPHNTHARDPLYFHHGLLSAWEKGLRRRHCLEGWYSSSSKP